MTIQHGKTILPTKIIRNYTDLLFRGILFVGCTLDVVDKLLSMALTCLPHFPLLSGYDEPKTLSYQINLFGPIGADVRQSNITCLCIYPNIRSPTLVCATHSVET